VPLFDLWLRNKWQIKADELKPDVDLLKSPCLPNRFVAIVPGGVDGTEATSLADSCTDATRKAWQRMCARVHEAFRKQIERGVDESLREDWDRSWGRQLDNFFDIRTAVLPWSECGDDTLVELLTAHNRSQTHFPTHITCAVWPTRFPTHTTCADLPTGFPTRNVRDTKKRTAGQWQYRMSCQHV